MRKFSHAIQSQLAFFSPYSALKITISSDLFIISTGTVADFVREIEQTCTQVLAQCEADYAAFYAQRLVQQFDLLKKTVDKSLPKPTQDIPKFKSNFRFAKNLANLPPSQRRVEYQKALRALNEKINWLIAQSQGAETQEHKAIFEAQIQETEFRKQKCLRALDELGK